MKIFAETLILQAWILFERLPVVPSNRASTSTRDSGSVQSKHKNRLVPILFENLVLVYHNIRVIEKMAENVYARTRIWLPIENEVEIEPDTETKLSSDDE